MLIRLDDTDRRPLHEQVASGLRRAIAEGQAGDHLPPAGDLAAALDVNTNTVLRALRALRDEGLLEFRRGRGIRIASQGETRGRFVEQLRALLRDAEHCGYGRADVVKMIEELP